MSDHHLYFRDLANQSKENLAKLSMAKRHIAKIRAVVPRMNAATAPQLSPVLAKLSQVQINR